MTQLRSIKTSRLNRATISNIWTNALANHRNGMEWGASIKYAAADEAIEAYRPKVVAMLRSAGFEVGEDEPIGLDTITDAIKTRTGIDLGGNLDKQTITNAISETLSIYVSHELGFEVHNVLDANSIKAQIDAHIIDCVKNNKPSKLVPKRLLSKIREAAAFAQLGYSPDERRMILNRWYQKKYRRNNRLVWD
jgi:hypothetical protein